MSDLHSRGLEKVKKQLPNLFRHGVDYIELIEELLRIISKTLNLPPDIVFDAAIFRIHDYLTWSRSRSSSMQFNSSEGAARHLWGAKIISSQVFHVEHSIQYCNHVLSGPVNIVCLHNRHYICIYTFSEFMLFQKLTRSFDHPITHEQFSANYNEWGAKSFIFRTLRIDKIMIQMRMR